MKIAVIDSGVHAGHPHINGIAGGVAMVGDDLIDRIGHGTAVAAAIREKAPEAELYAVKVFDAKLACRIDALIQAIDWCAGNKIDIANLSLGTQNEAHAEPLREAVERARAAGTMIVAAWQWWPGRLDQAIAVDLDWSCPRDQYRTRVENGRTIIMASGYPRPIPGVAPDRNLSGISFAVANVTGLLASGALVATCEKASSCYVGPNAR